MDEYRETNVDERDDVATLVRLAGKRPAVPHERAERVHAAARAQWRREVQRQARRRRLWTAAGLATAASLLLLVWQFLPRDAALPAASDASARVEATAGGVRLSGAGARDNVRAGDEIRPGAAVETAETGRAAIRLASGHSVRIDASTRLRLLDDRRLALDRGAVYVDSGLATPAAAAVRVETPFGIVQEIGTQFEVRLQDAAVRVRLREGAVIVRDDRRSHEVRAGNELDLGADGTVTRRPIPTHGSDWDWIADVTPMLDLEGRTVRAFLDWVARERGWTLAFADENVARSAAEIVLGGTVERLTLDQALDAVLPTCRMTYRVERGVLVIAAESDAQASRG